MAKRGGSLRDCLFVYTNGKGTLGYSICTFFPASDAASRKTGIPFFDAHSFSDDLLYTARHIDLQAGMYPVPGTSYGNEQIAVVPWHVMNSYLAMVARGVSPAESGAFVDGWLGRIPPFDRLPYFAAAPAAAAAPQVAVQQPPARAAPKVPIDLCSDDDDSDNNGAAVAAAPPSRRGHSLSGSPVRNPGSLSSAPLAQPKRSRAAASSSSSSRDVRPSSDSDSDSVVLPLRSGVAKRRYD